MYINATVGGATPGLRLQLRRVGNKLGSYAYLRVRLARGRQPRDHGDGAQRSDPDFEVDSAGLLAISNVVAPTETATVSMRVGDNIIVVNDFNDYLKPAQVTCFTVTIN